MANTRRLTMAQALVEFLNNQYVEFDGVETKFVEGIFTIFGHGNVLGLGQALEERGGDLVIHQGRNEQGIGHAAMGYAKEKLRRKIYACTSSVGPGAANMVTSAATATANRIPVLYLPGETYASRQPDPVLQQVEQPDSLTITTNDAFRAVTKYFDRIERPEQLMSAMINAMRVLTDPADTGAVCICMPQDTQGEPYDYPEYFFEKRVHIIERRQPMPRRIEKAVEAFKSAKKPYIVCGGGVKYSEAADTLKAFAEEFNIPYGETQAGKSAIEWTHEYNLGGMGTTGCLAANHIARRCDLVLGVGTRYDDFTTASKWIFPIDAKIVNINVAESDAYKLDAVQVMSDAKVGLEELAKALREIGYKSGYTTEIKEAKEMWEKELEILDSQHYTGKEFEPQVAGHFCAEKLEEYGKAHGGFLTQTEVLGIVNKEIPKEAVMVTASGSLPSDLQRVWRPEVRNTYHAEYAYSCMGYEVCGGFGAKLANMDREVYALVGDGAYMMLHSELPTSIQSGAKLNVILLDNMEFGCINNLEMGHGMGSFGTEMRKRSASGKLDGELVTTDFAMQARGYGCETYTVRTVEELKEALAKVRESKVSTLIDVKILPKTMTNGYEAFWRAGNAERADKPEIEEATRKMMAEVAKARQY